MVPNFEPVIEYGQRLCLDLQSKRDKSVLFIIFILIDLCNLKKGRDFSLSLILSNFRLRKYIYWVVSYLIFPTLEG